MRVSEGLQAQWHACCGIASGQGRAPQSRTGSSRERYSLLMPVVFGSLIL